MKALMLALGRGISRLFFLMLLGALVWFALITYPYWSALFAPNLTIFSQQNWHEAHHYKRLALARDFLTRHRPAGMSRAEVITLLGQPDHQTPHSLTYFLELTIADFMALSFKLDEQGKVAQAYIHQT